MNRSTGRISREQVFDLAQIFGCCLDGKDAKLDVSPQSGLAEVKTLDGQHRACFNWSVATMVMRDLRGQFLTQDVLDVRRDFKAVNRVESALRRLAA